MSSFDGIALSALGGFLLGGYAGFMLCARAIAGRMTDRAKLLPPNEQAEVMKILEKLL